MSELEKLLKLLAMLDGKKGNGKWPGVYFVLTDDNNEPLFQFRQTPDGESAFWSSPCGNPECDDPECGRRRLLRNWKEIGSWIAEAPVVTNRDEVGGDMLAVVPLEAGPPSAVYVQAEEWLNSLEALDDRE